MWYSYKMFINLISFFYICTDGSPMGQNLYIKMSTRAQNVNKTFSAWVKSMVKGWFDEVQLYAYGDSFSAQTGHYTQVSGHSWYLIYCKYIADLFLRWTTQDSLTITVIWRAD